MRFKGSLALMVVSLIVSGCDFSAREEVMRPAKVLYQHVQCHVLDGKPGTQWIDSEEALDVLVNQLQVLPPDEVSRWIKIIDFDRDAVLVLSMGRQATGGYALISADNPFRVEGNTAVVVVKWVKPVPGQIVTQASTHPCLILRVPRGNYHQLQVQDQVGEVKYRDVLLQNIL